MMNDILTRSLVSSRTFKPETLTALLVLLGTVLMMLAMKVLNPGFGSVQQIAAILTTSIFLVVAAYGQGLVILLGGIDLSIGVVMSNTRPCPTADSSKKGFPSAYEPITLAPGRGVAGKYRRTTAGSLSALPPRN